MYSMNFIIKQKFKNIKTAKYKVSQKYLKKIWNKN